MVNNHKVRTAIIGTGSKRTSFRFTNSMWTSIDMIAEKYEVTWPEFIAKVIKDRPHAKSKSNAVRTAIGEELLLMSCTGFTKPEESKPHPMLKNFYAIDHNTFNEKLSAAEISYSANFGSFVLNAGYNNGKPALFIENKLIGELSLIIDHEGL